MKLVLAIVSDNLIDEVVRKFSDTGFKSTKLASTGMFYKKGNTTLIMGIEDDKVEEVISLYKKVIESSKHKSKTEGVSDANIFILPMKAKKTM